MSWEWVSPVASAGSATVVGVVGVVSGWLIARGQRLHQLDLHRQELTNRQQTELREVRREVYARYIKSVTAYMDGKKISGHELIGAFAEVNVVAGDAVVNGVMALNTACFALHKGTQEEKTKASEQIGDAIVELSNAMRAELTATE